MRSYRVLELKGPLAIALFSLALLLGLFLAVWLLASAFVLALLLPLFTYGYAAYLRFRGRRFKRLPPA